MKRQPGAGRNEGEVVVGVLVRNRSSYFSLGPTFKPDRPFAERKGEFTMGDLLKFAGA